ncbi:MAG: protein kinase [Myxococcales bacterium]|nr:protein kinase [Myxococcales bacterium]
MDGRRRAASLSPKEPTLVAGRFRLGRHLGTGGMGAVYEAHDEWTGRRVALKRLNKRAFDALEGHDDPQGDERFFREARVIASLDHPHIVRLHDLGRDEDGALYLVQELLDGMDLRRWLRANTTVTNKQCVELCYAASDAIAHAHEMGVVHRDLKPENIFVERAPSGRLVAKVIDFGIARHAARDQRLTPTGQVFGTPSYMAPEQADGHSPVDPSWDTWALAIIAFEALAGRNPYARDNVLATLSALLKDPAPSLRDLRSDADPALAAVIDRALLRDRAKRFRDCAAFRDALLETGLLGDDDAWARALADRPKRRHQASDESLHAKIARDASSETAPIAATADRARTEATIDVPAAVEAPDDAPARVETTRDGLDASDDATHDQAIVAIGLSKPNRAPVAIALLVAALGAATLAARSRASAHTTPSPSPRALPSAAAPAPAAATHAAEARPAPAVPVAHVTSPSSANAPSAQPARRPSAVARTHIQTPTPVASPTPVAPTQTPPTRNVDDETSTPIRRFP